MVAPLNGPRCSIESISLACARTRAGKMLRVAQNREAILVARRETGRQRNFFDTGALEAEHLKQFGGGGNRDVDDARRSGQHRLVVGIGVGAKLRVPLIEIDFLRRRFGHVLPPPLTGFRGTAHHAIGRCGLTGKSIRFGSDGAMSNRDAVAREEIHARALAARLRTSGSARRSGAARSMRRHRRSDGIAAEAILRPSGEISDCGRKMKSCSPASDHRRGGGAGIDSASCRMQRRLRAAPAARRGNNESPRQMKGGRSLRA